MNLFRKQKLEISAKYKFYHKVVMLTDRNVCNNSITEIIEYLLLERFTK